jgi:hypothetical protein
MIHTFYELGAEWLEIEIQCRRFARSAAANAAGGCQACNTRGHVKSMHRLQTCRGAKKEATQLMPFEM